MSGPEPQRDIEAAVLTVLLEAHPVGLAESKVRRELTAIENSPERNGAIGQAVEALVEVGLVVRGEGLLRPTPPALRAAELEASL
jgi:hypothetical protein